MTRPTPRPAPRTADATPVRVRPAHLWSDGGGDRFWHRHRQTPLIGPRRIVEGAPVREVSFVIPNGPGEAIVHLNSLTDRHRTDITAARFEQVADDLLHVGYLLPDDLAVTYRIVRDAVIARDAGRDRPGWKRIHDLGEPDPRALESMPNPLGRRSSVLRMPAARSHPAWAAVRSGIGPAPYAPRPLDDARTLWLVTGPEPVERVVVLFDGEQWRGCGIGAAWAARAEPGLAVVLVDAVSLAERARTLPHPERVGELVAERVLPAVRRATGAALGPEAVIAAGQSFGGLAATSLVALRPDLVGSAVAQSGSFHFSAAGPGRGRTDRPGDLVRLLRDRRASGRIHVQAGVEEDHLVVRAREFTEVADAAGLTVTHEEWAGGHDYAWWTDGLFAGLDALAR